MQRNRRGRTRSRWAALPVSATVLAVSLAMPSAAAAQQPSQGEAESAEPLVTDRPDATESTETVAAGRFQLESGYTYDRLEGETTHSLGELLLRVGVLDRMEVRFGFNSYQWVRFAGATLAGVEDAEIGMKVGLVEGDPGHGFDRPTVALLVSASLPTGSSVFREHGVQPELRGAVAWDLSERLGLSSNLAWGWASEEDMRFQQGAASLALGYGWTDRVGTFLEYFGTYPESRGGPHVHFVNGGATYLLDADAQLDARLGVGLNGRDDDYFFGFGSAWRW